MQRTGARLHFYEDFDTMDRWVASNSSGALGTFALCTGKNPVDAGANQGLCTTEDYKRYAISAPFDEPLRYSPESSFVISFTLRHERVPLCAGGYLKVFPVGFDPASLDEHTVYTVMFGIDRCEGKSNHVTIYFHKDAQSVSWRKTLDAPTDAYTHLYELVLHRNGTYEVLIDHETTALGDLDEDFRWTSTPKFIDDPTDRRPTSYDSSPQSAREFIPDPNDVKPSYWDDRKRIPDPEATRPSDWDESIDGPWSPTWVPNPAYKGDWAPRKIPNPHYQKPWRPRQLLNPKYPSTLRELLRGSTLEQPAGFVGVEIWQVTSGSIFDNIVIGDQYDEIRSLGDTIIALQRQHLAQPLPPDKDDL
jgi:calreticulin